MGVYKELLQEIETLPYQTERFVNNGRRRIRTCPDTPDNRTLVQHIVGQLKMMNHEINTVSGLGGTERVITSWIQESTDYCMGIEIHWHRDFNRNPFYSVKTWLCN